MVVLETIFITLQAFQVLFLAVHDWVPLGPMNDVAAVRREIPILNLVFVTFIQTFFFAIGLYFSIQYFGRPYPNWLNNWLWISYLVLFIGQIQAWWIPYLVRAEPERAARYQRMFGNTHSFLPHRHEMVPNTAHILLHLATAATLFVLLLRYLTAAF